MAEYGIKKQADFFVNPKMKSDKMIATLLGNDTIIKPEIDAINMALFKGITPKMTEFGTSGSYILQGIDKKPIAIFKPIDEEPFAPNNPKGYVGKFG